MGPGWGLEQKVEREEGENGKAYEVMTCISKLYLRTNDDCCNLVTAMRPRQAGQQVV